MRHGNLRAFPKPRRRCGNRPGLSGICCQTLGRPFKNGSLPPEKNPPEMDQESSGHQRDPDLPAGKIGKSQAFQVGLKE